MPDYTPVLGALTPGTGLFGRIYWPYEMIQPKKLKRTDWLVGSGFIDSVLMRRE
ncbi:MAG: hypothetical protein HRU40_13920 [Saprospiraceae bacterium]|nr:hypothetical protein [Saprospiraceae bacterium]